MDQDTSSEGNRAESLDAMLADVPKAHDHDGVRDLLHAFAAHGCAPLLIHPGTKQPADCRTTRKRNADDRAAQEAARDAGRRNWAKVKSPAGLALASTDTAILDGYLDHYVKTYGDDCAVNLAVEVGSSRLVVVDCDTAEQTAAFLADAGAPEGTPPTVRSPGAVDATTGEWKHRDGGHFYFTVPDDVELPDSPGTMTDPVGGYAVLWNRRYVLTPPSVRAEGSYTVTGHVHDLPEWLRDRIVEHGQKRAAYSSQRSSGDGLTPIEAWGTTITWPQILGNVPGWVRTGGIDSCGCDVWTAPGDHASDKSATAHEWGCGKWETPDPPLYLWTDHPGELFASHVRDTGKQAITRLQAVALIEFENNMGEAMDALDLHDDLSIDGATGRAGDTIDDSQDVEESGLNLPEGFWLRPSLAHVRRAAWSRMTPPDAVLNAVLAEVSACIAPRVRVDTGILKPVAIHHYAGLVGPSGGFKSTAMSVATDVVKAVEAPSEPTAEPEGLCVPIGETPFEYEEVPHRWPLGSAAGIGESFMGNTYHGEPDAKGRRKNRRTQVRSNVLLSADEGNDLVKACADKNSTVGEVIRTMWSGKLAGQGNAGIETRRILHAERYTLAIVAGFQVSVLAQFLTADELSKGTPQRFLFTYSVAPDAPAEAIDDPGALEVKLPGTTITLCEALRTRVRGEHHDRLRGAASLPQLESQRPAMVVRVAALLAILDGRTEVSEDDWRLAETMFETSARIARHAKAQEQTAASKLKKKQREKDLQASIDDEEARSTPEGRAAARIVGYLADAGGRAQWSGEGGMRSKSFKGPQRGDADAALGQLEESGRVRKIVEKPTTFVELIG